MTKEKEQKEDEEQSDMSNHQKFNKPLMQLYYQKIGLFCSKFLIYTIFSIQTQ